MFTEYILKQGDEEIKAKILRSRRKTMALEVREDGSVIARVPDTSPDDEIIWLFEQRRDWVFEKLALQKQRQKEKNSTGAKPFDTLTKEEDEMILKKFVDRTFFYAKKMGVTFRRITIRDQKTRWGSCSAKGNLSFNYQLYYLPEELMDYVIIHELAHRVYMNHSRDFWALVEKYCPDYKVRRAELNKIRLTDNQS